ncbi:transporter substrate-binding domain-containing protein [Pseudomonas lijiangensis]|uniref:Transporter substrate-binding domain-containing protein n=2 Tax=Pseudomonas TaxID=286 RepID=A0ABX8HXJ7_9PSED|nr:MULTISPECIES: transporter substrate-binding domain-containing protein [Pseudomonas syringae group]MBX8501606.1 transporter substrate-binding domain-containing protein [Pseudomonas lijiangensis]MBX8506432.1 transporter substrate-binding domain-containing protein [Pseudomonas lijiangensis]MBX8518623.1 transporter substrate-binding domain-containing protein [Pseudomonas cichorii]MBX8562057.1 transporter substrate-binding domain-containing protein [Pseudomonas cichorii]MBX8566247.1 transporter 
MSRFSKARTLTALGLILYAGLASADATLDKIQERHKISIGVILSGPPFGTIDPKTGEHQGYNVELSKEIAKRLNVELETVSVLAPNRVQFLQQGKVDLLIANMQLTEERAQILDYVPTPYEEVGGAALIRKGAGISKWEDLKGKPVCVSQGSNFIKPLQEVYGAQIKAFRSQSESLLSLRGNGCVAAVHVSPTMHTLLADAEWSGFEIPLATDLIPSKSVIWLRKGEKDTQARLDAIVRDWHRSGWLIELGNRTGMAPSQALHDLHEQYRNAVPLAVTP